MTALQDPAYVEEYLEMPREEIEPYREGECAKAEASWFETDFDLDPTRGMNKHKRAQYAQGMVYSSTSPDAVEVPNRCCIPGCTNPIGPLSNYGYSDFSNMEWDDDLPMSERTYHVDQGNGEVGVPEFAGLCPVHADEMVKWETQKGDEGDEERT